MSVTSSGTVATGGVRGPVRGRRLGGLRPGADLVRIGCANQTTMLMSESLAIGEMFRAAMPTVGGGSLSRHFRAFDTICSATQERQDAVIALLDEQPLDLMLVVGGYNSSNTCNLARICAERVRTFHIADPDCLVSRDEVRHRPVGAPSTTAGREEVTRDWLPRTAAQRRPHRRRLDAQQHRRARHQAARGVLPDVSARGVTAPARRLR